MIKCVDFLTKSSKLYHNKYVGNGVENLHFDLGAYRVKTNADYYHKLHLTWNPELQPGHHDNHFFQPYKHQAHSHF